MRCLVLIGLVLWAAGMHAAEPVNANSREGIATAAEIVRAQSPAPRPGMTALDWGIVGLYVAGMIGLGWYYSRRQRTVTEYFLGSGGMNPALIGVSLFATLLSTISYLSYPGEIIGKGPFILAWLLGFPIAYVIVGYGLIPLYLQHRVTSAYELLEARLGLMHRLLGATLFILLRLVWMSVLTFVSASALVQMLGIPPPETERWTMGVVIVVGIVSVIYTSLGGLRAVVITDALQSLILLGGAGLVVGTITWSLGGFSWIPMRWDEGWDVQPVFSWDPTVRVTLVGTVVMSVVWNVCTAGGDQVSVQRFMATRDARAARGAYGVSLLCAALVTCLLCVVGLALLGFYQSHSSLLPASLNLAEDADRVFPHYIAYHLPVGISGLVVAGMLAAAMSSLDSGVNSISAVVWSDWMKRLGKDTTSERHRVLVMRLLTAGTGALVVALSTFVGRIDSNFLELVQRTANLLVPSIFALFVFALFVPFANAPGVLVGAIVGIGTAVLVGFSEQLLKYPISFQWIGAASLAANLLAGSLASLLLSPFTSAGGDDNT